MLRFVIFIQSTSCEFYRNDVITVTSLVLRTQSVCAVFSSPFLFQTRQANNIARYEKNEQS